MPPFVRGSWFNSRARLTAYPGSIPRREFSRQLLCDPPVNPVDGGCAGTQLQAEPPGEQGREARRMESTQAWPRARGVRRDPSVDVGAMGEGEVETDPAGHAGRRTSPTKCAGCPQARGRPRSGEHPQREKDVSVGPTKVSAGRRERDMPSDGAHSVGDPGSPQRRGPSGRRSGFRAAETTVREARRHTATRHAAIVGHRTGRSRGKPPGPRDPR